MADNKPTPQKTTSNETRQQPESGGVDRRGFIKGVATTGAAAAIVPTVWPNSGAGAAKQDGQLKNVRDTRWRIEAVRVEQTFNDGSTLPFFRFKSTGNTPSNGQLPIFRSRAGRRVVVRIKNTLAFAIQPTIVGDATGPIIPPGATMPWAFNMPPTGTWVMTDALLGGVAGPAGFAACIVSEGFELTGMGPIGREYFLLYQNTDSRWNEAIDVGGTPDESIYEPNYHTLNGLSYPHTMMDDDTRLNCTLGENVLVRMANLGHVRHSIHFHGYHATFRKRNNIPENVLPEKDTFELPAYSTAEIFLPIVQVGEYPIHPHSLTSVTDNGLYTGGQVTMIDASA